MRFVGLLLAAGCTTAAPAHPHEVPVSPPVRASFLERTRPYPPPKDVPHVDVTVRRREGPDALEWSLPAIRDVANACYLDDVATSLRFEDYDDTPFVMSIDTRDDGTMSDVEMDPRPESKSLVMCLIKRLAAQPLQLEHVPTHIVLSFTAHIWWSS